MLERCVCRDNSGVIELVRQYYYRFLAYSDPYVQSRLNSHEEKK